MPRKLTVKGWRKKCDDLLTPIIKLLFPKCLLCGRPTEVAHHFFKKSESTALRYVLSNLIPLCHKDHQALHNHESIYSSRIVAKKGLDWFQDLERIKNRTIVKADIYFYQGHHERLKKLLDLNQ